METEILEKKELSLKEIELLSIEKIKEIFDPEIPVNIWELGLIYDVSVTLKKEVAVIMTLTAPNCPEAGGIPISVEQKIREIEDVTDVKVILTFDPPWEMSKMSEEAKFELGFL